MALIFAIPSGDAPAATARSKGTAARKPSAKPAAVEDKPAGPALIAVTINTHPEQARVTANWPDGSETGESPLVLHAAAGTHLSVTVELDGYAPHFEDVVVDETDQTVDFALHKQQAHRPSHAANSAANPAANPADKNKLVDPFVAPK